MHPQITCPPFHVCVPEQSGGGGFPYFDHHDAVSLLWSKKWRPNCAAGLYPFFDGAVEYFDPIFAQLIRDHGDDPAVLYDPDEYAAPFITAAQRCSSSLSVSCGAAVRQKAGTCG